MRSSKPLTPQLLRLLLALFSVLPLVAAAHTGIDSQAQSGFLTGFVHPLTGLEHLAAMVAVGVWSALAARRAGDLVWGSLEHATGLGLSWALHYAPVWIPRTAGALVAAFGVTLLPQLA